MDTTKYTQEAGQYTTMRAAKSDGFQELKRWEYGGEQICVKGHALARNPSTAKSEREWGEEGYRVKSDAVPHAQRFRFGAKCITYDVYRDDQVEPAKAPGSMSTAYRTKSYVIARGWTDAGIVSFLGKEDLKEPNPHYANAAPMRLYDLKRVKAAEATPEFAKWREKSERRSKSAKASAAKRAGQMVERSESVQIHVTRSNGYVQEACDHYNGWNSLRPLHDVLASPTSDAEFLDRICVNYIRHQLTHYEEQLVLLRGQIGVESAYPVVKRRTLEAIAVVYPELAEECRRQGGTQESQEWQNGETAQIPTAVSTLSMADGVLDKKVV